MQFNLRSKEHKLFPSLPGDTHSVHQVLYWTLNVIFKFVEFFFVPLSFPSYLFSSSVQNVPESFDMNNLNSWCLVGHKNEAKAKSFEFFFLFGHNLKEYLYDEKPLFEIFLLINAGQTNIGCGRKAWILCIKFLFRDEWRKKMK